MSFAMEQEGVIVDEAGRYVRDSPLSAVSRV